MTKFQFYEVYKALNDMKFNKAPGNDKQPIEVINYAESETVVETLTELYNMALKEGVVPNTWKDVIICILFKKGATNDCNNYRGISLINHTGKVLERIIQNRLVSTVDCIFTSRLIASGCREKQIKCNKCFVDLTKAYDNVDREVLWMILKRFEINF